MTNEEYALQAQAGNADALPALWEQVEQLCRVMVRRYCGIAAANKAVDEDDLMQAAYLGLTRAIGAYSAEKGAFSTILGYYVRAECRAALGLTGRERKEHYTVLSLDAPIGTEGDTLTLADTVEDDSLPEIAEILEAQEMRAEIRRAVDTLPDQEAHIVRENYFTGRTLQQIAVDQRLSVARVQAIKTKGLRSLRKHRSIKALYIDLGYHHKGVTAFKSSFSSAVEDAVIRLSEHQELLAASKWENWRKYRY